MRLDVDRECVRQSSHRGLSITPRQLPTMLDVEFCNVGLGMNLLEPAPFGIAEKIKIGLFEMQRAATSP
jgi:hypothetical protein